MCGCPEVVFLDTGGYGLYCVLHLRILYKQVAQLIQDQIQVD